MSHLERILYAAALTAIVNAVILLVTAFTMPDLTRKFFSQHYWVVILVLAYVVAPIASRYLRRK